MNRIKSLLWLETAQYIPLVKFGRLCELSEPEVSHLQGCEQFLAFFQQREKIHYLVNRRCRMVFLEVADQHLRTESPVSEKHETS